MPQFVIDVDCAPAEVAEMQATLAKYVFLADGVRTIDQKMTKPDFFITPHLKKMVRKK